MPLTAEHDIGASESSGSLSQKTKGQPFRGWPVNQPILMALGRFFVLVSWRRRRMILALRRRSRAGLALWRRRCWAHLALRRARRAGFTAQRRGPEDPAP